MKKKAVKYPLLKKYKLTSDKISVMLGYNSPNSFRNSTAYPRIKEGLEYIIAYIEEFNDEKPQ